MCVQVNHTHAHTHTFTHRCLTVFCKAAMTWELISSRVLARFSDTAICFSKLSSCLQISSIVWHGVSILGISGYWRILAQILRGIEMVLISFSLGFRPRGVVISMHESFFIPEFLQAVATRFPKAVVLVVRPRILYSCHLLLT